MRRSPLDSVHRALGAKMVPFGGWEMPLEYTGTIDEHLACRSDGVVFDVSHLGTVRVGGADAFDRLQVALSNDLRKIGPGRAQYTHLLDDGDGSVVDDIIVWWHPDDDGHEPVFDVMPNASNTDRVLDAIGGTDVTAERAVIAAQGPNAGTLVADVVPAAGALRPFRVARATWRGVEMTIAGTGYTGERGLEIAVSSDTAADLWNALTAAGLQPAGLGARDTLRLEAGLPLHGQEIGPGVTPLQANLGWVVGWDKGDFRGRAALEAATGDEPKLVGIITEGRRPPRTGCAVMAADDQIGTVTSGNYSPVLERGIAMAHVAPDRGDVGEAVEIDIRGKPIAGQIVELPFVRSG